MSHAPIPADLNSHSLGPRLAATPSFLAGSHQVSKWGLEEKAASLRDVALSMGTIASLKTQMSAAQAPARAYALVVLHSAAVKNVDEITWTLTGMRY